MKRKMNQGVFLSIEAAIFQLSQEENTAFANGPQCPGSEKHDSLQFLSCVKTQLGHTAPFHEKRDQGKVFYECWIP